jgi:hypothetical protein
MDHGNVMLVSYGFLIAGIAIPGPIGGLFCAISCGIILGSLMRGTGE